MCIRDSKCGDPTARNAGRLTLNPLKHIDPIGTVLMPVLLALAGLPAFGYAKPVPVNLSRLRNIRNQSFYVALAGPATNIVLSAIAWVVSLIFIKGHYQAGYLYYNNGNVRLYEFIIDFGIVNLVLAVFNMLPIPPFDGSALIERLVPKRHLGTYFRFRAQAMPFAFAVVILLFWVTPIGGNIFNDVQNWWLNSLF